jgi:hypothetical protein
MKEQEILGIKWNLLFYYPLGENNLHGQIYDNNNENVIIEEVIKNQKEYDFILEVFTMANENVKKTLAV